jgi:hypothetical protein
VVVVGAVRSCHRGATMLVIGIILSIFGVGLFCWVIFTLAVYALPFLRRTTRQSLVGKSFLK